MSAATIGALMLETTWLHVPGAIAHSGTFALPVVHRTVAGATGRTVVGPRDESVARAYARAAEQAADDGVALLTTNCGFAVAYQDDIREAGGVPTATSSVLLLDLLERIFGRVGVLTFDRSALDVGTTPVADVQGSAEWRRLADDRRPDLDLARMREDLDQAARSFVAERRLQALLLECTAMSPFKTELAASCGVPAFDVVGLVDYLVSEMFLTRIERTPRLG